MLPLPSTSQKTVVQNMEKLKNTFKYIQHLNILKYPNKINKKCIKILQKYFWKWIKLCH